MGACGSKAGVSGAELPLPLPAMPPAAVMLPQTPPTTATHHDHVVVSDPAERLASSSSAASADTGVIVAAASADQLAPASGCCELPTAETQIPVSEAPSSGPLVNGEGSAAPAKLASANTLEGQVAVPTDTAPPNGVTLAPPPPSVSWG